MKCVCTCRDVSMSVGRQSQTFESSKSGNKIVIAGQKPINITHTPSSHVPLAAKRVTFNNVVM